MIYILMKMEHLTNKRAKRVKLICILLLPLLALYSQQKVDTSNGDIQFDKTKVTLGSWLSFYNDKLNYKGYDKAQATLPIKQGVSEEVYNFITHPTPIYNEDFIRYTYAVVGFYPKNKKILDQPITGITQEQINEFCSWRNFVVFKNNKTCRIASYEEYQEHISESVFMKDDFSSIGELCYRNNQLLIVKLNHQKHSLQIIDSITALHTPSEYFGIRLVTENTKPQIPYSHGCCVDGRIEMSKRDSSFDKRYGLFTDNRDGKTYRTIKLGKHTWMAENLAFIPANRKGYFDFNTGYYYSYLFGGQYEFEAAQRACPKGWHIPSKEEFEDMLNQYTTSKKAYSHLLISGDSGFSVVYVLSSAKAASFWTSSQFGSKQLIVGISDFTKDISFEKVNRNIKIAVRCVKDE